MNPIFAERLKREHQEKEKLFKEIAYGNLPIPVQKAIFEKHINLVMKMEKLRCFMMNLLNFKKKFKHGIKNLMIVV